jgi:hypothetical protein
MTMCPISLRKQRDRAELEQLVSQFKGKVKLCPRSMPEYQPPIAAKGRQPTNVITHQGQTLTVAQWAAKFGVPVERMRHRMIRGASLQESVRPARKRKKGWGFRGLNW